VATKPWRFASLLRTAAVILGVVAVGTGVGVGAVALTQGGAPGPKRRPPTPSVAAFRFPTQGAVQAVAVDLAPADSFVEPVSARAALEDFLGAERDVRTGHSFRLLTSADQRDIGSAAAWAESSANRPKPLTLTITSEQPTPDGEEISVVVSRRPSLDQFAGYVSAQATQVWHLLREGSAWRVVAEPVAEDPALPPVVTAADVAGRWVQASAACNRDAAAALEAVSDLIAPQDLLAAPCAERGSWTVTGAATTLDRAADTQAFVEAYGPDVGTWTRLVPVRGPRTHFLVAVAPLGDDWRVIGVTSDGG
jgi:hypothetical protein